MSVEALALLFGGLTLAVVVIAVVLMWKSRRSERALGQPELTVAPGPYALGDVVRCRILSTVRSPVRVEHVSFTLECCEEARWLDKTTLMERVDDYEDQPRRHLQRVSTATVWRDERRAPVGRDLIPGQPLEFEADLALPLDRCPSFSSPHNKVTWSASFSVQTPGGMNAGGTVGIKVEARRRVAPAGGGG